MTKIPVKRDAWQGFFLFVLGIAIWWTKNEFMVEKCAFWHVLHLFCCLFVQLY